METSERKTTIAEGPRGGKSRSALLALTTLVMGLGAGYLLGIQRGGVGAPDTPPESVSHTLSVRYGDLGPKLLTAGAIDLDRLDRALDGQGMPLSEAQRAILQEGRDDFIEIDRRNGLFLLNLFWALGLTNQNPILTQGPMTSTGLTQVGRFASTAGWRLGAKASNELFASIPLVTLTAEEQERLARVAHAVYRPCCDNPTDFPDCNHGMAMLGMLTVLAAAGADEEEMFEAAAAANRVWYPQQYRELGTYFSATNGSRLGDVAPRRLVDRGVASRRGYQRVRTSLAAAGLLEASPAGGVSAC